MIQGMARTGDDEENGRRAHARRANGHACQSHRRACGSLLACWLFGAFTIAAVLSGPTSLGIAAAQPDQSAPVGGALPGPDEDPCVVGATVTTEVNGPAPVGRCAPPRRYRLIDSAVWVFTLGCFVAVLLALAVSARRSQRQAADREEAEVSASTRTEA